MDVINVVVMGEHKSGKSTFASALKLTKFNPHILNVMDYDGENLKNCDIVFYVMEVTSGFNDDHIENIIGSLNQCLFIPVFNKLDMYDFTIDDKTGKVSILPEIIALMRVKLARLEELCTNIMGDNFCNEQILCSAEIAYMYLYLSTCTKSSANSDPSIVSKIGQYELGKLQWNKKTAIEKSTYATSIVETLKKPSKLTTTLNGVGYTIQPIIHKYITDQMMLYTVQKHLINFQANFNIMTQQYGILDVLKYANDNFTCVNDQSYLSTYSDITSIINDISAYINTYDYMSLDFHTKSEVLQFYRSNKDESVLFKNIDVTPNVDFLTAILSQEIGTQLGSCETFYDLVNKLYDYLDINDDIYVDQILLNHKTFKILLFNDDLQQNIEHALSKFELDVKTFFLQIMEMKLTSLLNKNEHLGMVESMLCVQEFLDTKHDLIMAVPSLSKYRILLKYALSGLSYTCNKDLLINKIDNESTLYVENIYYDLICTKTEDSPESDTSDEEESTEKIVKPKSKTK